MEIKDLQREIIDAERLAERGKMLLDANQQIVALTGKVAELEKENAALKAAQETTNVN